MKPLSHEIPQARATRAEHFNKGGINLSRYLVDGLVGDGKSSATPSRLPLKPNNWTFVYWDGGVYVAKGMLTFAYPGRWCSCFTRLLVLTFYSKEAGSGTRHAWQASTSAISALSYLVVQAFEKTAPSRFRSVHRSKAGIRADTFFHLPSNQFLCRLQGEVVYTDSQTILVADADWTAFQKLSKCSSALGSAIKGLNGATRGKKV
jgi:hypothetical protein